MVIKNQDGEIFEGNDMANHMNDFLYKRARLVDDETINTIKQPEKRTLTESSAILKMFWTSTKPWKTGKALI